MSATNLCVLLGFVALWSGAQAATVYRIVGPDGKVTFSDTPPPAATSESYRVVGAEGAAPRTPPAQSAPPPAREPASSTPPTK